MAVLIKPKTEGIARLSGNEVAELFDGLLLFEFEVL